MLRRGCLLLLVLIVPVVAGCTMAMSPVVGGIYTDVKGPLAIEPANISGRVVEGKAMAHGILGFATGDCSYKAAYNDALSKVPGATKLLNVQVDHHTRSVLGIYAEFTTVVRGVAVK
ncbi:MAG: TRL domain-containing protein [Thermodesulfobacteriota bacterium]|nr:TRL domain-containing protein [Thermodesulfobacteriota bacterium]